MAITQRLITATVQLANNPQTNQPSTFAESGSDTVTLSGSRCSLRVQNSGGPAGTTAQFMIWGLTRSLMDQLSTLGLVFNIVPKNTITISAGDAVNGMSVVFVGVIVSGYGDYNKAPDVPFMIEANSSGYDFVASVPPSSFQGTADVATIMSGFARQMGIGFENNGITAQLVNPYFSGTIWQQVLDCRRAAHINADKINGGVGGGQVLSIWPIGGNRNTPNIPLVAPPAMGGQMIGYPSYTQQGIKVDSVFNPQFTRGGLIQVKSNLPKAAGQWAVTKLDLALDSLVPKGQWMATMYCYNPNYPQPLPPSS
jgi:hypothetical protein